MNRWYAHLARWEEQMHGPCVRPLWRKVCPASHWGRRDAWAGMGVDFFFPNSFIWNLCWNQIPTMSNNVGLTQYLYSAVEAEWLMYPVAAFNIGWQRRDNDWETSVLHLWALYVERKVENRHFYKSQKQENTKRCLSFSHCIGVVCMYWFERCIFEKQWT